MASPPPPGFGWHVPGVLPGEIWGRPRTLRTGVTHSAFTARVDGSEPHLPKGTGMPRAWVDTLA